MLKRSKTYNSSTLFKAEMAVLTLLTADIDLCSSYNKPYQMRYDYYKILQKFYF